MTIQKRESKKENNDSRIAVLENNDCHLLDTLSRIEVSLMHFQNKVETRFSLLESKIESGLKEVNNRLWTNFFWKLGAFAALLAVMAHGFQWI